MEMWRTLAAAACILLTANAARAATTPEAKCASAKRRAAGKKVAASLGCYARAKRIGDTVDPNCLAAADAKFQAAFQKAGFACPGLAADVGPLADTMTTTLVADVPGAGACQGSSVKAVGKGAGQRLVCAAKEASKPDRFGACADKADAKLASALTKAGSCGQAPTIVTDLHDAELHITRGASPSVACCNPERITLQSGAGTLKLGGLLPFPYPAGVITVVDTAAADGGCRHDAVVPAGGFAMPAFCIPALFYTAQTVATGCTSGAGVGRGAVWDGNAGTNSGVPQAAVAKRADSSDGACDSGGGSCANRDLNTLGHVGTIWSTGGDPNQVSARLDVPVHMRVWQDAVGCPGNGFYNPAEGDTLILEFDTILSPTTATATGQFVDENADGCALPAGSSGFGAPSPQCAAGSNGPCGAAGSPARGPCCVVGQTETLAAAGIAFSNNAPLYDIGFITSSPNSVVSCGSPGADGCAIATGSCLTFGTTSTSTTTTTSTTTSTIGPCCNAERTTLTSTGGTLKLGSFSPFPFPAGAVTKIDSGSPDATCRHDVVLPANGFVLPPYCIPGLAYTAQLTTTGCTSGVGVGRGEMWDGHAGGQGGVPQGNVSKTADSSDQSCDNIDEICADRDTNTLGRIETTLSTGGNPNQMTTRFDVPIHIRLWQDAAGCPGNGIYNPAEGDSLILESNAVLSPTTATATGQFADLNVPDGCVLPSGSAGFGPPSAACSAGGSGPCSATGSAPAGPCCHVGDTQTQVAVGMSFSNSFPLYDFGFISSIQSSVTSCGSPGGDGCTFDHFDTADMCRGL